MVHSKNSSYLLRLVKIAEDQIEQARKISLESATTLEKKRADGGWSILQCFNHLNTYCDHYLPLIEGKLEKTAKNHLPEVKNGWLGKYFIGMMASESGKKYKAAAKHQPTARIFSIDEIETFVTHTQKLRTLLLSSENTDLNTIKIQTSLSSFIKMRLGDTFEFILAHNERHIKQAWAHIK